MRGVSTISRVGRIGVAVTTLLVLVYLAVRALRQPPDDRQPPGGWWFGRPDSWQTVAIVVAMLGALCVWTYQARNARGAAGVPIAVIGGLIATTAVLGFSSYWPCHDRQHPSFFTPLMFTATLVKGDIGNQFTGDPGASPQQCPTPTPVALEVARLSALAAIFVSVVGVAVALFRAQTDRIHIRFARSVTAVVGVDDDSASMLSAILKTQDRRATLVVITAQPERSWLVAVRGRGARIVKVDFDRPETLRSLSLWHKLGKLYLLSPDPSANLQRLGVITERLSEVGAKNRLPLIVRIDDPWQAEVWRAQHFGESDTRWAADAVGKYEVTASRLLDAISTGKSVDRIIVCGTSRLTLAVCADMAQRRRERDYFAAPDEPALPSLIVVAGNAEEYLQDHAFHQQQLGFAASQPIEAVPEAPSVPLLTQLIGGDGVPAGAAAVIFVDADPSGGNGVDSTIGTRLAARFPDMPIYAWDPDVRAGEDRVPIVGQLRTYRLGLDIPDGQAHDAWERAAMLIHSRYAAGTAHDTAATQPWTQLDEFYRASNRRQVRNALWMVEQFAGHTWSIGGRPATDVSMADLQGLPPLEQLGRLGFDRDAALAMAREEHEDWCRYYTRSGWRYGPIRDNDLKIHNKLVDWATVEADDDLRDTALRSLAATLLQLRELGYRSRPVWEPFRRNGTVTAEQRSSAWTWTARSGQTMRAAAGDWALQDAGGDNWSVRDDIFRESYQQVGEGRWRRTGVVHARPARVGETIGTLEGPVTAAPGDWVVRGTDGELWPVSSDRFAQRYERIDAS
jgi:hypothetical protein